MVVIPPSCPVKLKGKRDSGKQGEVSTILATLSFGSWTTTPGAWEKARLLWGDDRVTKLFGGPFTAKGVAVRFMDQIVWQEDHGVEYWPVFVNGDFAGCCGLKPNSAEARPNSGDHVKGAADGVDPELLSQLEQARFVFGFHFLPKYWSTGVAGEASRQVLRFAFFDPSSPLLLPQPLTAHPDKRIRPPLIVRLGHHPTNVASQRLTLSLGFVRVRDEYFAPTKAIHPNYIITPQLLRLKHQKEQGFTSRAKI